MSKTKRSVGVRSDEACSSKRRKTEQDDTLWPLRPPVNDLKLSSLFNRGGHEVPAELFRKDYISAMKLPDSQYLAFHEYWVITDSWKQEWERGVQVPVNPESLPAPEVEEIANTLPPNFEEFRLPKNKYIHLTRDSYYQAEIHHISTASQKDEAACSYDLDATDTAWLKILNGERARAGVTSISEDQLERVLEELEVRCGDKIQTIIKSEEGLGIEYDENVICDVCRSPDSEEGNEMVFCDACNICVHQACYGITTIPSGQWLCRPCGDGVRPVCVLCPNLGGAMKCTPTGNKWAHVSCVLWIPEVSIGCAEKMEPITKISAIPQSRWSLICILCRERKGACIQCSVKTCKTAYHVTCAFKHGLEMRAIIEDENADDGVKLRSYCQKHSNNSKKEKCNGSGSEEDEFKRKRRKDMTSEEKSQARVARLQEIEKEFDKHVSVKDISAKLLNIDQDTISYIYNYWKLKRRAAHNRPLLPPKSDDTDLLSHRQEQADLDKMKMFLQLRQDLERVRNLCYMVSRREKLSRSFFRMREQTFHKQVSVLESHEELTTNVIHAVIQANHGPSIYDRLYSHTNAPEHSIDFETILNRIACDDSEDEKKKDINGLLKSSKTSSNPYKKVYINGSSRRTDSLYSGMSSDDSSADISRTNTKSRSRAIASSTEDDDIKSVSPSLHKSTICKDRRRLSDKKKKIRSRSKVESSSEDEFKPAVKRESFSPRSKTLQLMEQEMISRHSGTDSDELIPIRSVRKSKLPVDIYSDSSENSDTKIDDFNDGKSPNTTSDSQHQLPRTKGAMKEFVPVQKSKNESKSKKDIEIKRHHEEIIDKENKFTKLKDPTELIVPQRKAAKKASENLRYTSTKTKDVVEPTPEKDSMEKKSKQKSKPKEVKEKVVLSKKTDIIENEKEERDCSDVFPYVPQRQAAKKAAAHIKSGLGNKFQAVDNVEESKRKEPEKTDLVKKKEETKPFKSPIHTSSSSSSSTSSSSYSSSSSSDEESKNSNNQTRNPSPKRESRALPFHDKVSKAQSFSSSTSDSEQEDVATNKRMRTNERTTSLESSPRKAPDKKFKTSERWPEPGSSSPPREKPRRNEEAVVTSRTRTRSITSGGNLSDNRHNKQRKSSKHELFGEKSPKATKETCKSSQFSSSQWKTDEALNSEPKIAVKNKEKEEKQITSKKSLNENKGIANKRRSSYKTCTDDEIKSSLDIKDVYNETNDLKITKDEVFEPPYIKLEDKKSPNKKSPKVISPVKVNKKSVFSPDYPTKTDEKYEFKARPEQKSHDSFDKLYDSNLLISNLVSPPKTPEGTGITSSNITDVNFEKPRKRSSSQLEKSNEQDLKKYHKSSMNSYPTRSIFSPQPTIKDNAHVDLFDFGQDMLAVEDSVNDGFGNDEIIKPFSFGSDILFKEDSKGVQETLNLVEKLRMTLSSKKPISIEPDNKETKSKVNLEMDVSKPEEEKLNECNPPTPISSSVENYDTDKQLISDHNTLNISNDNANDALSFETARQNESRTSSRDVEIDSSEKWMSTSTETACENKELNKELVSFNMHGITTIQDTKIQEELSSVSEKDKVDPERVSIQSAESHDQITSRDNMSLHGYDNNNSLSQADCISIPSSYTREWGESKITHTRTSESSVDSDESQESQKETIEKSVCPTEYQTRHLPSYPIEGLPFTPFSAEVSPFVNNQVPLFGSSSSSSTLPLTSTSVELFTPTQFGTLPVVSKPVTQQTSFSNLCAAAFTTSTHNIALTTAMVAPPTPQRTDEPIEEAVLPPEQTTLTSFTNEEKTVSDTLTNINIEVSKSVLQEPTETQNDEHKSSHKVPKLQAKLKSPAKSPLKSPKQHESGKSTVNKRNNKNTRNQRGRGRSKTRATHSYNYQGANLDYSGNSIHSKLQGTVYEIDFDEDNEDCNVDLKSLRDRRKSVDVHERKSESLTKSPAFTLSPNHSHKRHSNHSKESKLTTPKHLTPTSESQDTLSKSIQPSEDKTSKREHFPTIVQPLLPGPVNMRTYQSGEGSSNTNEEFWAREDLGTELPDQTLPDIDEEIENDEALLINENDEAKVSVGASFDDAKKSPQNEIIQAKVTHTDSRNQLKVKIKGPFLDANYSTSSVAPVVQQPIIPSREPIPGIAVHGTPANVASVNPAVISGSSNLRRMRKKELLRQYWTQDMNMEDNSINITAGTAPPPVQPSPISRTIITIPKAVASMTTIPTREDYKAVVDANMEKKRRKVSGGLARELRHLDASSFHDDPYDLDDNSVNNNSMAQGNAFKRRGRGNTKTVSHTPIAPKLKIKIGSNFVQPVNADDNTNEQFRPPKKRLANFPKPSFEDLRRESMKYRRKVMADFEDDKKEKKRKTKTDKRKKKKDKKADKLEVVSEKEASKLIIRISRKKDETCGNGSDKLGEGSSDDKSRLPDKSNDESVVVVDPFEYDPTAQDPLALDMPSDMSSLRNVRASKVTPIRLKIARSAEGSGYIMKDSPDPSEASETR